MSYKPISKNLSPADFGKVAVLMGDTSAEREISLQSGQAIANALTNRGITVLPIDIQQNYVQQLIDLSVDRVFIAMHGGLGEGGHIQALLDGLRLPYTGSGMEASVLAMNKLSTKQIWQACNLPTPKFIRVDSSTSWSTVEQSIGAQFILKPVKQGSTIGISVVENQQQWQEALTLACSYGDIVIAEEFICGPEFTVAILNQHALPPIKITASEGLYDYEAKYISSETRFDCPCDLTKQESAQLCELAKKAFSALACQGWGRVDLMRKASGEFTLLEVNTVPGMTNHSLVPMAAKVAGLDFEDLVVEILSTTLFDKCEQNKQKQASVI